jgi:uncharacterized protein (DUF58 family)
MRFSDKTSFFSALLSAASAVFPLTLRGLALFLLAALLLVEGLVRSDLASLFWGASFLLYTIYAVLASHSTLLLLKGGKGTEHDLISVTLPPTGMATGEEAEAQVSAQLPRVLAPGFSVLFYLPLSWHDRRVESVACRLSGGTSARTIRFKAYARGVYRCDAAVLEARDVLGFTLNRVRVAVPATLTIHPTVTKEQSWRIRAEGEAPSATTTRRRRSEELLEVRKYYPGDDARRMNWKVFAHSRELFLRVGEETPPPESRILFILDTSANPLVPPRVGGIYLDALVNSCASAMDALLSDHTAVLLCAPGIAECVSYELEKRAQLLVGLADVWWTQAPWKPALPRLQRLHVAVFSTPGSPGLAPILGALRDRGWSASLFLKEFPTTQDWPKFRLHDLFFVRSAPPPKSEGATIENLRKALHNALTRDLAAYGWKVTHARNI